MPPFDSGEELSLRHLPDVSDTSFSFQIPGIAQTDNLLADDDLDFFRGADVSIAQPLFASPSTTANEPLTLSQLTPRPTAEKQQAPQNAKKLLSFPTLSHRSSGDTNPKQEKPPTTTGRLQRPELKLNTQVTLNPKPNAITSLVHLPSAEGSPANARLEVLRAEVESLTEEPPAEPSAGNQALVVAEEDRRPKGIRRRSLEKKQLHLREERREKHSARTRQKLIEGGITKTRNTSTNKTRAGVHAVGDSILSRQTNPGLPSPRQPVLPEILNGADQSLADTSVTSSLGGGVAERLVQYSQKLINSFGLFNSDTSFSANSNDMPQPTVPKLQDLETGTEASIARPETPIADRDRPLTLSQISPRKTLCSSPPTPPVNVPMSPLRPSSKRPVSVASETNRRPKKSKRDASAVETVPTKTSESGSSTNVKAQQLPPTRRHPRPANLSGSGSRSSSRPVERAIKKTKNRVISITKKAPVSKPGSNGGWNDDVQLATKSGLASKGESWMSRPQDNDKMTIEPTNSLKDKAKNNVFSSTSASLSRPPPAKRVLHAHAPTSLRATKPAGPEARLEARIGEQHGKEKAEVPSESQSQSQSHPRSLSRSESQSQSRSQSQAERERRQHHPIPDFKALHAAHDAEVTLRKENIHPTVPLPMHWETDIRVQERKKFDEKMKERERELERLEEERRREREREEEREVRELRKRAIPKAHEVPEWYSEMPKKKDKAQGAIGR